MNYGIVFSTELQKRATYEWVPALTGLTGAALGGLAFPGKTGEDKWWSIGSGASLGMVPGMFIESILRRRKL